jgi:hypothetical protein
MNVVCPVLHWARRCKHSSGSDLIFYSSFIDYKVSFQQNVFVGHGDNIQPVIEKIYVDEDAPVLPLGAHLASLVPILLRHEADEKQKLECCKQKQYH